MQQQTRDRETLKESFRFVAHRPTLQLLTERPQNVRCSVGEDMRRSPKKTHDHAKKTIRHAKKTGGYSKKTRGSSKKIEFDSQMATCVLENAICDELLHTCK